jgi:hypothetical protein
VIVAAHICAQALDVLGDIRLHLAITNVREPVSIPVSDVVVFEAGFLDSLEEVDCLLGVKRVSELSLHEGGGCCPEGSLDYGGTRTQPGHR